MNDNPWIVPLESYVCINGQMYPSDQPLRPCKKRKTRRTITPLQKKLVAAKQRWDCAMCQERLMASYEVDHIVPLWAGGNNEFTNLQALCRNCHGEKTLRDLIQYKKNID